MSRHAAALIAELRAGVVDLSRLALVVRFEDDRASFVWADESNAEDRLAAEVQDGGTPVGVLAVLPEGPRRIGGCALSEYAEEEWVGKFLTTLEAQFQSAYKARTAG